MEEVPITLSTIAGETHHFSLPSKASVADGKSWLAAELGRPADLQRWLADGMVLEDGDMIGSCRDIDSDAPVQVVCVFLPRTFDVSVKVIKFTPGSQAQSADEVSVSVSPSMTIDAAKFEALSAASARLGIESWEVSAAARLIKGGLHLKDEWTMERYHIDPNSTLHLIIPRSRGDDDNVPGDACGVPGNASHDDDSSNAARQASEMFHRVSCREMPGSSGELVKEDKDTQRSRDILSPRTKAAASMFASMGVHRVRPRRATSTPVLKSQSLHNGGSGVEVKGNASAVSGDAGCQAESVKGLEAKTSSATCAPQKPCEPRVAPPRPL